jgi:hypothetical protein
MTTKYPEAFIEQALVKAFSRGSKSITMVAEELNVNHHTLRYWMKNEDLAKRVVLGNLIAGIGKRERCGRSISGMM